MAKEGLLAVVSGFSGAGKGTIMKKLLKTHDGYALSISATTRKPRSEDKDGVTYFFKTKEEFESMIEKGELYEYASYQGNYYGTPKAYVDEQRQAGKDVLLEIEVQGAAKIKEKFPETILVFVTPPSAEILRDRLVGRGTETEEEIRGRLARAAEEAALMDRYDYILVNDDLDRAVEELDAYLHSDHKNKDNKEIIEKMNRELAAYVKGDTQL